MGQIHRNTFIASPRLLDASLALKAKPHLHFAGQITGVEGYVESAACGHLVARAVAAKLEGRAFVPPPVGTAFGALHGHVSGSAHPEDYDYQPTNVTWGLFPPLEGRVKKQDRRPKQVAIARALLTGWLADAGGQVPGLWGAVDAPKAEA